MEIGGVKINSRLALAPMAGVTDAAFRQICSELGAGLTYTELVSAKALCYQDKKSRQLLRPFPGERPFAAQIFGSDITCMAEAAQIAIEASGADLLDINMGCPVGKVVSSGDGAALMKGGRSAIGGVLLSEKSILHPQGAPGRHALQTRLHFLKMDFPQKKPTSFDNMRRVRYNCQQRFADCLGTSRAVSTLLW